MERVTTGTGDPAERALILRLWREGEGAGGVWRCSVEDPRTKQRRGFASLAELLPFLDRLTCDFESAPLLDASGESAKQIQVRAQEP